MSNIEEKETLKSTNGMVGYPNLDEEQDKSNFINMFVWLGYEKERAESIYGSMKNIINLFNVPLSSILECVVREVNIVQTYDKHEKLINISNRCMDIMADIFQYIIDDVKSVLESTEDENI